MRASLTRRSLPRHASATPTASRCDALRGSRGGANSPPQPGTIRWCAADQLDPIAASAATIPTIIAAAFLHFSRYPAIRERCGAPKSNWRRRRQSRAPHRAAAAGVGPTGRRGNAVHDQFFTTYPRGSTGTRTRCVSRHGAPDRDRAITRANDAGATVIAAVAARSRGSDGSPAPGRRSSLNFLAARQAVPDGFYQYALSPRRGAPIAERVVGLGQRRGVALVPSAVARVPRHSARNWPRTTARSSTRPLFPADNDYSTAIASLLGIVRARRHRRLEQLLGMKLAFNRAAAATRFHLRAGAADRAPASTQLVSTTPAICRLTRRRMPTSRTPRPTAISTARFPDMPWCSTAAAHGGCGRAARGGETARHECFRLRPRRLPARARAAGRGGATGRRPHGTAADRADRRAPAAEWAKIVNGGAERLEAARREDDMDRRERGIRAEERAAHFSSAGL